MDLNGYPQVEEEISRLFDFMEFTYGLFGFEFSLELSTRPENYLGHIETWNEAEAVSHFPPTSPSSSALCLARGFPTPLADSPNIPNRSTALAPPNALIATHESAGKAPSGKLAS